MALILDKTLLRLGIHILSMDYLKDIALYFTKVIKHNNIDFDRKLFEDENDKKDGKEAVTNSKEETSKNMIQYKAKRDIIRALLLVLVPELSASISVSIPISGLSTALPRLSAAIPRLSATRPRLFATLPELSATLLKLFTAVFGLSTTMSGLSFAVSILSALVSVFVFMPGLSAPIFPFVPTFAFVLLPGLSAFVSLSISALMPGSFFLSTSFCALVSRSSFCFFLHCFYQKHQHLMRPQEDKD